MPPLLGHPSNFAPIGAMALFGGAYLGRNWKAFLIPLLSLWISDLFINYIYIGGFSFFYPGFYWQYGCFALIVLLGSTMLKKVRPMKILGASLSASVLFFIISNFGVWTSGLMYPYPMTIEGLMTCYIAAIPFFGGTLSGDLVYSGILFGAFELAKYKFPVLAKPNIEIA